jgi:hypothetical protein
MHICGEELEMYVLERLLPERVFGVEAHLTACSRCAGKLPDLVGFAMQLQLQNKTSKPPATNGEQRREQRIPTNEQARMRLLSPFSSDTFEIRVLNVSRSGLKVSVPFQLQSAVVVQVFNNHSIILGEVRYCVLSDAEHHAGIQIRDVVSI